MAEERTVDLNELRRGFAERISGLIGDEKNSKNLEIFSKRTRVSMRQLSQWSNPRQINWPSITSLASMCWNVGISPTWLIFGVGPMTLDPAARKLKTVSLAGGITDAAIRAKTSGAQSRGKKSSEG